VYKLYWRERTGAFAPAAVMEELGIRYEGIHLDEQGHNTAEFRAKNPMAQIPLFILPDGSAMTESGAIALYLAETKPESGLAPLPDDPIRAQFLRWFIFAQVNLYETNLRYFYSDRYTSDAAGADGVKRAAAERFDRLWDMTATAIQGPFYFGARFTLLDIYLAMLVAWHFEPPALLKQQPKIAKLVEATLARPATAEVWRRYNMHQRMGVRARPIHAQQDRHYDPQPVAELELRPRRNRGHAARYGDELRLGIDRAARRRN
jgi:glutathione S-transferase